MVHLSCSLCKNVLFRKAFRNNQFLDSLNFIVKGGNGGNGLPKYGGVGGVGGDVICQVGEGVTLKNIRSTITARRLTAASGGHSVVHKLAGAPGENKVLEVPAGVTVYSEFGNQLGELNKKGDFVTVAYGGEGGNAKNGWLGQKGEELTINLELKLIADIGLVGFPNAGKSTLLKAISNAKPKIASYPFTTLQPRIGVIKFDDLRSISVADLPGLIEGAHKNVGMGHRFLRHIERTKLILMVVDINGFQLGHQHPHRSCVETILLLNKELELYRGDLLEKPAVLVLNKMDVKGADQTYEDIKPILEDLKGSLKNYSEEFHPKKIIQFDSILPVSLKYNESDTDVIKQKIRNLLDLYTQEELEEIEAEKELLKKLKAAREEKGELVM